MNTKNTPPTENVGPPPEKAALPDPRWELVNRIAGSSVFRKSPRLRQFLLFVAEKSLTGHAEEITEYEIGWKVFERSQQYNPSDDSIVRTAARQLRAKVREYFDTEGREESWILEIPKGGYVPVFTMRDEENQPALIGVRPSLAQHSPVRRWQILSGALALIAIIAAIAGLELGRRLQSGPAARAATIVSTVLKDGQQPTRIVVGDFGLVLMSAIRMRDFSIEEYANRGEPFTNPPSSTDPALRNLWAIFAAGQVVSLPDTRVATAIIRLSTEERKNVILQHASRVNARDLRSGNAIMLSAPVASPWINLFQDKLNFRYHIWYEREPSRHAVTEYENLHPLPGEKQVYPAASSAPGYGVTYGLVARVPNLTGTGKVLLICGLKYTGFEAAGEYATDPKAAAELARSLKVSNIMQAPDFDVLLETYAIDAAPR